MMMSEKNTGHSFADSPKRRKRKSHEGRLQIFFTHPEAACIDLEYPAKLEQLPFFA